MKDSSLRRKRSGGIAEMRYSRQPSLGRKSLYECIVNDKQKRRHHENCVGPVECKSVEREEEISSSHANQRPPAFTAFGRRELRVGNGLILNLAVSRDTCKITV